MDSFTLSDEELAKAVAVIQRTMPGTYTLANLYGPAWLPIDSPTTFGSRFKAAVEAGRLRGVELHPEKTGANAVQYIVHGG